MIDRGHELSVSRQAQLLELPRSTVYYLAPHLADDLALMRRMDELYLEHPIACARMLRDLLRHEGPWVGRKHVGTLMARMGIGALYRHPNTSRKHSAHRIYNPYLLPDPAIEVWAITTHIPMRYGFVYLAAVMDWASRRVLAWRFSITLTTDQARASRDLQYRSREPIHEQDFTDLLNAHGIAISMEDKGCWRATAFVERFWKLIKYEVVYLHAYDNVSEARAGIGRYIDFFNQRRPHRALDGDTLSIRGLIEPGIRGVMEPVQSVVLWSRTGGCFSRSFRPFQGW